MSKRSENQRRAENGRQALEQYCCRTGDDFDSAMIDLLTDLRHYNRLEFARALRISGEHYEAEK